jgi:serine/threonine-protein kinase
MLGSFAGYDVLKRLAVGGMGEVFLARQTGLAGFERLVVVKTLLENSPNAAARTRFFDEARLVSRLNHPNVVSVLDARDHEGTPFLVLEYIPGWNLSQLRTALEDRGLPQPAPLFVRILADAARGLAHAHDARSPDGRGLGLVHRDVSPQNIIVRTDGVTKIIDFGIAWATSRDSRTQTGTVVGKTAYLAPEQVLGQLVDARTDQFALGIVAWELFSGRRLFHGRDVAETLRNVLGGPIPSLEGLVEMPVGVAGVVERMLQRTPDQRFASCGEIADLLDALSSAIHPAPSTSALRDFLIPLLPPPAERSLGSQLALQQRVARDEPESIAPTRPEPTLTPEARGPQEQRRWVLAATASTALVVSITVPLWLRTRASEEAAVDREDASRMLAAVNLPPSVASSDEPTAGPAPLALPVADVPPPKAPHDAAKRRVASRGPRPALKTSPPAPEPNAPAKTQGDGEGLLVTNAWMPDGSPLFLRVGVVGGRRLCTTPCEFTLTAGTYELELSNEERGIVLHRTVEITPGVRNKLAVVVP